MSLRFLLAIGIFSSVSTGQKHLGRLECAKFCIDYRNNRLSRKICNPTINIMPKPATYKACLHGQNMAFEHACKLACTGESYKEDSNIQPGNSYEACKGEAKKSNPNDQLSWCRHSYDVTYNEVTGDIRLEIDKLLGHESTNEEALGRRLSEEEGNENDPLVIPDQNEPLVLPHQVEPHSHDTASDRSTDEGIKLDDPILTSVDSSNDHPNLETMGSTVGLPSMEMILEENNTMKIEEDRDYAKEQDDEWRYDDDDTDEEQDQMDLVIGTEITEAGGTDISVESGSENLYYYESAVVVVE